MLRETREKIRSSQASIERYFDDDCLTPGLRAIGRSQQRRARPGALHAHTHDCYEICLITHGDVDWWVGDEHLALPSDSVFITAPGEVHGSVGSFMQPCTLTWCQIDQAHVDHLLLPAAAPRHFMGAQRLSGMLLWMLGECRMPKVDSAALLAAQLRLFCGLLRRQQEESVTAQPASWRYVDRAIEYWHDHPVPWPSIEALAAHAGVSRSRLFQLFNERFGQSPAAYMMQRRLRRAQGILLRGSISVTDVALTLGFASSQHFATAFRRHFGLSPRDFRAQYKQGT